MKKLIDKQQIEDLIKKNYSYKEIATITNFNYSSIVRFCLKHFGKLKDRGKSTRQSLIINNKQKEILFGSLLGDCCIRPYTKTFRGAINHSTKQEKYAKFLHTELEPLCGKFRYTKVIINDKIYDECQFTIRPNLNLEELYTVFYKDFNGKKDVPYNLELLTPLAIAIWFMDDGFLLNNGHSKSLGFSTCSFSLNGLLRLKEYLYKKYNIETIIRKNFYLIVRKKDAKKLALLMRPYIVDSMLYKIEGLC